MSNDDYVTDFDDGIAGMWGHKIQTGIFVGKNIGVFHKAHCEKISKH